MIHALTTYGAASNSVGRCVFMPPIKPPSDRPCLYISSV